MSNTISRPGSRWAAKSRRFRTTFLTAAAVLAAFGGVAATTAASAQAASAPAKYKSTASLTGTKTGRPTLKLGVSDKVAGGRKIMRVAITLPRGFSFNKARINEHVKVINHRFQAGVHNGVLTIDPKSASATLQIDVNHAAITETRGARSRTPGKVMLRVTELPKRGSVVTNRNVVKDLEVTITTLVADLRGLGTGSNPLLKLVGTLGEAVHNLGRTVSALGNDLKLVAGGKYGSKAQSNLKAAESDLKAAFTDLSNGNTSGAAAEFQKAAAKFQSVLGEAGTSFPGASGLKSLIKQLKTVSSSLGAIGSGSGSGAKGNPGQALQAELNNLLHQLKSKSGTGVITSLLTTVIKTLDGVLGDLTGVSGTKSGADLTKAAVMTQEAVTDLSKGKTAAAQKALKKAEADVQAAVSHLPSGASGATGGLTGLVTALETIIAAL